MRINAYLHEKGYLKWKEVPDTRRRPAPRRQHVRLPRLDRTRSPTAARRRATASTSASPATRARPASTPEEYEALRKRLIRDLEDLKDPATGERIITEIHQREDVFPGAAMHDAPDLLLVLRDFGFVSIKNKLPVVEPRTEIAGTHHPDGVFLAYGPGISQGATIAPAQHHRRRRDPALQPGPDGALRLRGRGAAGDVHRRAARAAHPIVIGAPTAGASRDDDAAGMGEDEKEQIMAQLQMLGYME